MIKSHLDHLITAKWNILSSSSAPHPDCQNPSTNHRPVASDLAGFWDMLQLSIENISLKFDELHQLRANNWRALDPPERKVGRNCPNEGFITFYTLLFCYTVTLILSYVILYSVRLCYTLLYSIILSCHYSAILCCALLFSVALLHCIMLCYALSYFVIFCCTITLLYSIFCCSGKLCCFAILVYSVVLYYFLLLCYTLSLCHSIMIC